MKKNARGKLYLKNIGAEEQRNRETEGIKSQGPREQSSKGTEMQCH
jgi:hypothetical protein